MRRASEEGGLHYVRQLLCRDPDMKREDIVHALHDAGFDIKVGTISTAACNFRKALEALQEAGMIRPAPARRRVSR